MTLDQTREEVAELRGIMNQVVHRLDLIEQDLRELRGEVNRLHTTIIVIGGAIFTAIVGLGIWDRI